MNLEKQIVQNFSNSEKWFIKAYQALKKVVGGGNIIVDIDFKDFTEILSCIKGNNEQEMFELIDMCKNTVGLPYVNQTQEKQKEIPPKSQHEMNSSSSLSLKKSYSTNSTGGKELKLVCAAHNL